MKSRAGNSSEKDTSTVTKKLEEPAARQERTLWFNK